MARSAERFVKPAAVFKVVLVSIASDSLGYRMGATGVPGRGKFRFGHGVKQRRRLGVGGVELAQDVIPGRFLAPFEEQIVDLFQILPFVRLRRQSRHLLRFVWCALMI